jgi:hypothetical protein
MAARGVESQATDEALPEVVIQLLIREGWPRMIDFLRKHAAYWDYCKANSRRPY